MTDLEVHRAVAARGLLSAAYLLPREPGTYALVLECPRSCTVTVGRLGRLRFPAGCYVYVGSALGPGGLRARLLHHLVVVPKPRWHVDYLRAHTTLVEVWYRTGPVRWEDQWASALREAAVGSIGRFGSSDCRCGSHLFRFFQPPDLARLLRQPLAVFRPRRQPRTR